LYSGEQFDSKIGQQYLRQRYYDPATGRFNRLDPFFGDVSDPQSLHKYTYTHGDPVNMTDPSGLFGVGGVSVSISISGAMSGVQAYAAYGVRKIACGALSGAVVGSILGALLEAVKHADMAVNGNNIDPTDMSLNIVVGALQGAQEGMISGAADAAKELASLNWSGKYDQVKGLLELNKTAEKIISLYGQGKYFEATFVGISTIIEIGFGPKLNSLFCFVNDTTVMLDTGEISGSEAVTVIERQIETIRSQYGGVVTSIMIIVVSGLLIQSRRNRKQNPDRSYQKNITIFSKNDQENKNEFVPDNINTNRNTNTDEIIRIENSAANHNHQSQIRSYLVTSGLLIILMGLVLFLWNSYRMPSIDNTVVHTILKPVTHSVPSGIRFAKIQDVQVGERAIGINPEITDSERSAFLPDPEPTTWRKLTLEMIKSDGKRLDITLLRPLVWLEESQADIGATIYLDLPEMGAQGFAKVRNIEPCPPIKRGKGNVITGTFHHEAANTIDIHVEGLSKPIGCTDNHPFWSVARNEFVEAGKLLPGEELQLYSGQTTKIVQIFPRQGSEQVHNLEVMNEHVYRVTDVGILAHNMCAKINIHPSILGNPFTGKLAPYQAYKHLKDHHGIDPNVASVRLHNINERNQMNANDDVAIGRTGDVYDPNTGEWLGSLTNSASD
jgi:RHS repeat-associated protein